MSLSASLTTVELVCRGKGGGESSEKRTKGQRGTRAVTRRVPTCSGVSYEGQRGGKGDEFVRFADHGASEVAEGMGEVKVGGCVPVVSSPGADAAERAS